MRRLSIKWSLDIVCRKGSLFSHSMCLLGSLEYTDGRQQIMIRS